MPQYITIGLIIAFFLLCLIIGFISGKKETNEGYFIANRSLGTLTSTATITASFIGANTLLIYTAFVFIYGISAFWMFVGYMVGFYIFGLFGVFLKKRADIKKYYTLSDYFHDRHGKGIAAVATFAVFVIYFGSLVNQYIGGAKVLSHISGWPYELSLAIAASVILIYLFLGGFKAVVKTDVFQYMLIIILPLVLIFSITSGISVPSEYFNIFNAGFLNIIAFLFYGLFSVFIYAEFWQRAYAAKDNKTVKKAFTFAGISYLLIGIFFTYIGLVARTSFPEIDSDLAAIHSFTKLIPVTLIAVTMIMLFAVIMSSADTILFVLSMNISQDILNRNRTLNKKKELLYTKISIVGFTLVAVTLAIFYPKMADNIIVYVSLGIGLSPLVVISWLFKNPDVKAMIISFILTSLSVLIIVIVFNYIHPGLGLIAILECFVVYFVISTINRLFYKK